MELPLSDGDMNLILQAVQALADQSQQLNGVEPIYLRGLEQRLAAIYQHDQSYLLAVSNVKSTK